MWLFEIKGFFYLPTGGRGEGTERGPVASLKSQRQAVCRAQGLGTLCHTCAHWQGGRMADGDKRINSLATKQTDVSIIARNYNERSKQCLCARIQTKPTREDVSLWGMDCSKEIIATYSGDSQRKCFGTPPTPTLTPTEFQNLLEPCTEQLQVATHPPQCRAVKTLNSTPHQDLTQNVQTRLLHSVLCPLSPFPPPSLKGPAIYFIQPHTSPRLAEGAWRPWQSRAR